MGKGLPFSINGYAVAGIRRGDLKVCPRIIRTDDSKRSKDGTGHMKTLAWKKVITVDLHMLTPAAAAALFAAIKKAPDAAVLSYFDYTSGAQGGSGETFYVSDFDFTDEGVLNGVQYSKTSLEFIKN